MKGQNQTQDYYYIKQITYDLFEQRTAIKHGNNTVNLYTYDEELWRLESMTAQQVNSTVLFQNDYTYDYAGNITELQNSAVAVANKMGGSYSFSYEYDKFNRLSEANGSFSGYSGPVAPQLGDLSASFSLQMSYDNLHNITAKTQSHTKNSLTFEPNTYENGYTYLQNRPHQIESITNALTQ